MNSQGQTPARRDRRNGAMVLHWAAAAIVVHRAKSVYDAHCAGAPWSREPLGMLETHLNESQNQETMEDQKGKLP